MFYQSEGVLEYNSEGRAVVWIDQGISDLYRKLCPKYYYVQPQMYPAHITVVRKRLEIPKNMDVWNKYQGEKVPFEYEDVIRTDGTYFFLNILSERIGEIRLELGLPKFRFSELGSDKGCYHTSIGNVKHEKV
jgi:hypothetical protein